MQVRTIAAWALTSWMAFAAVPGAAQQDEGPILRPRAPAAAHRFGQIPRAEQGIALGQALLRCLKIALMGDALQQIS